MRSFFFPCPCPYPSLFDLVFCLSSGSAGLTIPQAGSLPIGYHKLASSGGWDRKTEEGCVQWVVFGRVAQGKDTDHAGLIGENRPQVTREVVSPRLPRCHPWVSSISYLKRPEIPVSTPLPL